MQKHWQVLILTGLVFSGEILGAQPFTVFVHDFAGVEQLVLERAESEAGRILRTVGIEPTWVNCRNSLQPMKACDNPPGTTELVLHVLPGGTARDAQPDGALGFAVPPESGPFGSYAGVLYDRVERLSSMTISKSVVLGHVMAHELGHLLLGV